MTEIAHEIAAKMRANGNAVAAPFIQRASEFAPNAKRKTKKEEMIIKRHKHIFSETKHFIIMSSEKYNVP